MSRKTKNLKSSQPKQQSPETKVAYLVMSFRETAEIHFGTIRSEVKLSFAEGMIGCVPVFKDRESADAFAEGKFPIFVCEIGKTS